MRKGAGTSKGESLCSLSRPGRGTMDWHGRQFPHTTLDGDVLPDAFMHDDGLLPHLHGNFETIFPKAYACEDLSDEDPFEDVSLEACGIRIGRAPGEKAGKTSGEGKDDAAKKEEFVKMLHQRGKHDDPLPKANDLCVFST